MVWGWRLGGGAIDSGVCCERVYAWWKGSTRTGVLSTRLGLIPGTARRLHRRRQSQEAAKEVSRREGFERR